MEGRIREDIREVRNDVASTRETQSAHEERIKSLEQKAGWIGAGIGTSIAGVCGLAFALVKQKLGL
jgi:hypothetical protein